MNNMNKENKFPYLEQWCKRYYEDVGLKIHPSNVPTDVILNELLETSFSVDNRISFIIDNLELMTIRFEILDKELVVLNDRILKLEEQCKDNIKPKVKK